jgi:hypothetical protein
MPIYEFYCPANNRIYQFFARTQIQGRTVPACPDNPKYSMQKVLSSFAVVGRKAGAAGEGAPVAGLDDARMEVAMGAMEKEMAGADQSDPRAMGRMIRRMAEISGERMEGDMEEVVRKLEEGADPESLDAQLGDCQAGEIPAGPEGGPAQARTPRNAVLAKPTLDPRLHDYP